MHLAGLVKFYPRISAFPFAANVIFSDILKECYDRLAVLVPGVVQTAR